MPTISSVASDVADLLSRQTAQVKQTATAATTSFQATLTKVQNTIAGKPSTGFTAGPTYEANSWTGQTKAAFDSALSSAKSAVTIRTKTGFNQ
jgi:uncharacterized membrane protein